MNLLEKLRLILITDRSLSKLPPKKPFLLELKEKSPVLLKLLTKKPIPA